MTCGIMSKVLWKWFSL